MKNSFLVAALLATAPAAMGQSSPAADRDWSQQLVALRNLPEADALIRVGDIDNLGFGFPEDFPLFCGQITDIHPFPWEANGGDAPGTDRILLPGSYGGYDRSPCDADGYAAQYGQGDTRPAPIVIPLSIIKGLPVQHAVLQLFIDDFQPLSYCSQFQVTLNGKRFADAEFLLNHVNQTGPVGRLVSFPLPENLLPLLAGVDLRLLIDDPTTRAGDGFAIDFVRLIVNPKKEAFCYHPVQGYVYNRQSGETVAGATVEIRGIGSTTTDADGFYQFPQAPAGLQVAFASAPGYDAAFSMVDVVPGDGLMTMIYLDKATKKEEIVGNALGEGESVVLDKILFDVNSAALRPESRPVLDEIAAFLQSRPEAQIELSGHTSSEGSREGNRSLSFRRVQSCKEYIVSKGIDDSRILTVGYGPDRPVASNDTEANRARNRRVEMRVLRL